MNFSSRTSSMDVQRNLESVVEKRTKDTFGPPLGKKMLLFIDDMNMPIVSELLFDFTSPYNDNFIINLLTQFLNTMNCGDFGLTFTTLARRIGEVLTFKHTLF